VLRRLGEGWDPFVLDVRLASEADICRLPFTDALVPHRRIAAALPHLPPAAEGRDILVYCKGGVRSRKACAALAEEHGLPRERLFELDGGIVAWAREIDPSMPVY